MPDLIASDVTKVFPTRSEPIHVLRGCSLELSAGENVAVLGPSGSGKSTFLQILGTLDAPTSGTVSLQGQNPFDLAEPELAAFRNHKIGFVFQEHHLLGQCTVLENVLLPTIAGGKAQTAQIDRAKHLLDRVGLSHRLDHRPAELSGGERQRVAIARSLILQPELLLADEPTGNLDRSTATAIADLLVELQQQEQTMMVIVTHSIDLAGRCGRQLEINAGRLQAMTPAS